MPRAVIRAMQILEMLGTSEVGLSHAHISKGLRIPKSSTSPILTDLISTNFISLNKDTKKYSLGPKIVSLVRNYLEDLELIKAAEPVVKELSTMTGESVALYVRAGGEAQLVCKQNSPQPVLRLLRVGDRAPMYAHASGKVLLAYLSPEEIDHYLSSTPLSLLTPRTITDPKKLREELGQIRSTSLSHNREEFNEGVFGLGAPVHDRKGDVIAALSIVAPSFRINEKRIRSLEEMLLEKSISLSRELGFEG